VKAGHVNPAPNARHEPFEFDLFQEQAPSVGLSAGFGQIGQLCHVFGLSLHVVGSFHSDTRNGAGTAYSTCEHIGGGHRLRPMCGLPGKLGIDRNDANPSFANKNGTLKCRFRDVCQINQVIKPLWWLS
jgi:hypothetical protein